MFDGLESDHRRRGGGVHHLELMATGTLRNPFHGSTAHDDAATIP
jgi:hypothetical protein